MSKIWKFGADVDTDQIVPGRYAPYMRPDADVAEAAFIEARPEFAKNAAPGDVIVALENFGCGSSREYAVEALRRRKVGAIFARSFARIFYRNAINLGIPLFESEDIVDALEDGEDVILDLSNARMTTLSGKNFNLPEMPEFAREIVDAGGVVSYVRQNGRFPGES